jgi:hypothetical protein
MVVGFTTTCVINAYHHQCCELNPAHFVVLFMNEFKNLTYVVIGKLGKLVHKQNCCHDFFCLL